MKLGNDCAARDRYQKGTGFRDGPKKGAVRTDFDDDSDNIFELIIPKNDPTNACIKMNASFHFSVTYQAQTPVSRVFIYVIND